MTYPNLKKTKKVQSVDEEEKDGKELDCSFIGLGVLEVHDDMPTMIEGEEDDEPEESEDFGVPKTQKIGTSLVTTEWTCPPGLGRTMPVHMHHRIQSLRRTTRPRSTRTSS